MIEPLLNLDQSVFYSLNSISGKGVILDAIFRTLAIWPVYLVCLGLLVGWFVTKKDENKITALAATISGAVVWQVISRIIGDFVWMRPRPFVDIIGTKELFFHVPTYSFPSDHTAFLAAIAFYLMLASKKNQSLRVYVWIMWSVTILVGFSRVIAGLHFPGDIIGGFIVGILTSLFFYEMRNYWYEKYFIKWFLLIAKKLKLA